MKVYIFVIIFIIFQSCITIEARQSFSAVLTSRQTTKPEGLFRNELTSPHFMDGTLENLPGMFDIRYWRCVLKRSEICPDNDVKLYLYNHETGNIRKRIHINNPDSLIENGWDANKKNVIIIHGFNGTESKTPMTLIRNAYVGRTDYNIFTIDWEGLTIFPCYLSALSNTRIVAQCTAQLYSYLTHFGALAKHITCVGHSLGAHICGMISNYLDFKQYRIVGLDPARPIINKYADKYFRLTKDDAHIVQIIHTNAGFLGETNQVGTIDFCVNGGQNQPGCKGHQIRRARCSHFQSACYFAQTVSNGNAFFGRPCSKTCPNFGKIKSLPGPSVPMGESTPDTVRGTYCVQIDHDRDCPFN